jgi:Tol biopolymer transport system component/DNA-binding winged helix-turn-helix (wHTH) protein
MASSTQVDKLSFDVFEVDLKAEELWRGPRKVRCQRQPFRVLRALLERPGEVVSREELQQAIWGDQSPSDSDHSLGIAINKLRDALGDSADFPRFVETLSRRGYRFIAPVTAFEQAASPTMPAPPAETDEIKTIPLSDPAQPKQHAHPHPARPSRLQPNALLTTAILAGFVLAILAALSGFLLGRLHKPVPPPRRIEQLTHNDSIFPGVPAMESFPVLASDGNRIYSAILDNGDTELAAIDPGGGDMQQLSLPSSLPNPTISDLSPDGNRLLVRSHSSFGSEQPLWIVPRNGGSALRVGNVLAHDAVWMPDGQSVLYAAGNDLNLLRLEDGTTTHYATLPGRAFWMRWSPDGQLLRLTLLNPLSHTSSLWQLAPGSAAIPILTRWSAGKSSQCCGSWTSDGRFYVFQSMQNGTSDLWQMRDSRLQSPRQLTNGPLRFAAPVGERGTDRIYFAGLDVRSELQRFDRALNRFVVDRDFLRDAARVSYARDRQWVAWTDGAGRLWRARAADGTERVQLTPDNLEVFLAHWSPDGSRLIAMAREPGHAWQLYLLNADGGRPERLLNENRNEADPSWSSDGKQIAFGRVPDLMGHENGPKQILLLDLATRKVQVLTGSDGLFSPRWSPDGRWLAALTLGEQRLMLYDTQNRTWHAVGDIRASDPVWTADSSALYIHAASIQPQTIDRVAIPSGAATTIATMANLFVSDKADYVFVGITRDDAPLVRVRTATGNLYALDLAQK